MKKRVFALQIAGVVVLAMSFAPSVFAESRHREGTRSRSTGSSRSTPSRSFSGRSIPRFDSRGYNGRNFESRRDVSRSTPRYSARTERSQRSERTWRSGSSSRVPSYNYRRSTPYRGGYNNYNDGHRFYGRGRIDRIVPYRGGYRVWLGGWGYPFFVPYRFYDPFRFRLGLFIGVNAFYDPLGYYSMYGWPSDPYPPAAPVYRDGGDYQDSSTLRGTVESVDLQTGIVIINDDASRRRVAALLPPRDNRVDDIRPGDFVELSGEWTRGRGYDFDADRLERFDPRR